MLTNDGIRFDAGGVGSAENTVQYTGQIHGIEHEFGAFAVASNQNVSNVETNKPLYDSHPVATHHFDPLNHIIQNPISYALTPNQYQNESPHVETAILMPAEASRVVDAIRIESTASPPLNDKFQIDIESTRKSSSVGIDRKSTSVCATVPTGVSSQIEEDVQQSPVAFETCQPFVDDEYPSTSPRKISSNSNPPISDDAGSVEEALRALDLAIGDEEFLSTDLDADDVSDDYTVEQQENDGLHDAFSDFLVKNSASRFNDYPEPNIVENADDDDTATAISQCLPDDGLPCSRAQIGDVIEQAKELVDGVISDCENYFQQLAELNDIDPVSEGECSMLTEVANEAASRNYAWGLGQTQDICEPIVDTSLSRLSWKETEENSTKCESDVLDPEDSSNDIHCDKDCKAIETEDGIAVDAIAMKPNDESTDLIPATIDSTLNSEAGDVLTDLLDDSINEAFGGNLAASTPCVKLKIAKDDATGVNSKANLMSRLSDGSGADIPVAAVDAPPANELQQQTFNMTYDAEFEPKFDATYTNADDKTFATDLNGDGTFCVANKTAPVLIIEPPRLKIDRDEVTSEDLNTATPLNTPIEINYMNYTWDKFDPHQNDLQAPKSLPTILPSTDLDARNTCETSWFDDQFPPSDGTFVRATDGTFNFDDCHENNDEDDYERADDEGDDNRQSLDFTLNELRKQLTLSLPHASGSGAMSAPPVNQSDDDDDDIMEDVHKEREG